MVLEACVLLGVHVDGNVLFDRAVLTDDLNVVGVVNTRDMHRVEVPVAVVMELHTVIRECRSYPTAFVGGGVERRLRVVKRLLRIYNTRFRLAQLALNEGGGLGVRRFLHLGNGTERRVGVKECLYGVERGKNCLFRFALSAIFKDHRVERVVEVGGLRAEGGKCRLYCGKHLVFCLCFLGTQDCGFQSRLCFLKLPGGGKTSFFLRRLDVST